MSDEPIKLADGMMAVPREHGRIESHVCEHAGCGRHAGFGFAKPRQTPTWFCLEHREDGERCL
ncbi:MAG: hypothetical protein EOR18_32290 [Mesorhizobium sp.]|nr:MAG: hypothetical protein EOQ43_33185 [Mesorhizobium sp.]RWE63565.1 MAG: hypothetical protein EOS62_31260 [Mesorhizobium sp.]RWI62909.1 MAG: hypothetical protein EOR18_32290 [Mesorhizobium sp.]TJV94718.1 MAG: hypothetical protein E5X52_27430 [Mesorhizobium sp.]